MNVPIPRPARLVLLSVDGLRPGLYRAPDLGKRFPNLTSLEQTGASAEAVESVYPTTTYPVHATIVTGLAPAGHGICSHLASLDPTEKARPWCWYARGIRAPALWDVARASGRKSAAISWPVSVGAAIDLNLPEIWDPAAPNPLRDFETVARHATTGLFREVAEVLDPMMSQADPDRLRGDAALYLWNHYRPDLLLVHFVGYDHEAHAFGPESAQALAALEVADQQIGRFRDAITPEEPAVLVVLSDHGFVPVEKEVAPLAIFAEQGLFARGADGSLALRRLGAVHGGGSFAVYWLEQPSGDDRRRLDAALQKLEAAGALREIVGRGKLAALEADPDAELILDAAPGFYFSDRLEGPVVQDSVKDRGTHGQLPDLPGMEATFIAAGRDIAAGKSLGRIAIKRIAPTLVRLLGLPPDILAPDQKPLELV